MSTPTGGEGAPPPIISVVMPAYNAEAFLAPAIDSVLAQTLGDLELIVVDDGSIDGTWQIVEDRAARDGRVRGLRNDRNLGIATTLNRGIDAATADLIGRMDADDLSLPHRFERQVAFLEAHPEVAVVGSYVMYIDGRDVSLGVSATGPTSLEEFTALRRAGSHTMVFGGTAVFHKRLVDEVGGYDPAMVTAEDLELFDRMAAFGPVLAVPEPLVLYRISPGSHVLRTFFEGRTVHRFVADRRRRQLAGEPEITLGEYRGVERSRPWMRRALTRRYDVAQYLFRRAGVELASRRRGRAIGLLALAAAISPRYAIPRVWSQRLSPMARRARRSGRTDAEMRAREGPAPE